MSKSNKKSNKFNKKDNKKNKKKTTTKQEKINKNGKGNKKGFWQRHHKLAIFLKIMIFLIVLLVIIGVGAVIAIFTSDNWTMTKDDLIFKSEDTIIYDKDGNEIANVSGIEKRRTVPLSEIPQDLQDAFISIEDERFYSHNGVDIKRTLASTVKYVLNMGSASAGGGSTITQQTVKNFLDDKDNSGVAGIQRKIREISRAYKLEQMLSKDQILELYLNLIFLGSDVYGVELGSQYYFNKSVTELTLTECAFLAGINHSPNSYNPFGEEDNSAIIARRTKIVLNKMLELEKITQEEYDASIAEVNEGIKFEKGNTTSGEAMSYLARAALNQVINQYAEEKDVDTKTATAMIQGGGYRIYTTQDSNIQAIMEDVYTDEDYIYSGRKEDSEGNLYHNHTQSAMVVIDHKTGKVVGCMGGLGDDVNSNGLNRAMSTRQPGSSIKPIAAIAPALEAGIITASTVYDESPSYFGNYHPTNSGKGLITVRKAVGISANTTEVKIMSELGTKNSITFMRKMGITSLVTAEENSETNDENLAMVLGGLTYGISPLEMAGAYAAIANDGIYITPTFYTRVEDVNGNTVLEPVQEKTRVMSEANAFILQSILTEPVIGAGGTATDCKISGQDTAAKTGTTTDNLDKWLCGFTEYYTAATWYGYDNTRIPEPLSGNALYAQKKIWKAVMSQIHKDLESAKFEKPSNVVSAKVCLTSGKLATEECENTYTEYFVKGTLPDYCDGHTKLTICTDTGKIATENCPNTEEKVYTNKPEKEDTTLWRTDENGKYDIPTETCDV
ncbi:MAG: transglycosylase domain-containing protein, partial [Clostridia bacterium]